MRQSLALRRLRTELDRGGSSLLGVGPMSRNCVDAAIAVANERRVPLMLIASRRQIECAAQGGGYVNGWTTETFATYVRSHDRGGYVALCRDHGGPWQGHPEREAHLGPGEAMTLAKESLEADLAAGFDFVHLDPSALPASGDAGRDPLDMLLELYEFVAEIPPRHDRQVAVEIGAERQDGGFSDPDELVEILEGACDFCEARGVPLPWFVVAQTGTLVQELGNVGVFAHQMDGEGLREARWQVERLVAAAARYGVRIKEHNGDYLGDEALRLRPAMGIGGVNVAPQLGVLETRCVLDLCGGLGLEREAEAFVELAYATRKWEKWLAPGSAIGDRGRAVIAGHYTFGTRAFEEIWERIKAAAERHGVDARGAIRSRLEGELVRLVSLLGVAGERGDGRAGRGAGMRVDKPWGYEEIITVTDRYCFKQLFLRAGHRTSLQLHREKHETAYFLSGRGTVEIHEDDRVRRIPIRAGLALVVTPGTVHRVIAKEDCHYLEASTPEVDDVVRLDDDYARR